MDMNGSGNKAPEGPKEIFRKAGSIAAKMIKGTVKGAAKLTCKAAGFAIKKTVQNREPIGRFVGKTAEKTVKGILVGVEIIYENREGIFGAGRTVVGTMAGTTKAAYDAGRNLHALVTIKDEKLRDLEQKVQVQAEEYHRLNPQRHYSSDQKNLAIDTLVVGGNTLTYYMSHPVPKQIQRAFELEYPDLATKGSFANALHEKSGAGLEGFISGVKGKLFELQYVDYLNEGHLPAGYAAVLASNATQQGWDFQIEGPDNQVIDQIQLKATDSVGYVKHALERYPGIDVVSTSEVHSHLVMQGFGERVADGHIADAALTAEVTSAVDHVGVHMHFVPSILAMALIAYSSYSQEDLTQYQKGRLLGERAAKTYLAFLIGGSVAVATQTWWVGLVASVGSRILLGQGRKKREQRDTLKDTIKTNEKVLKHLRLRATM